MENQSKLLEMLQEMRGIAAAQQNKLTKKEIAEYLGDGSFSETQMRAVYQYLGENGIDVEGYDYIAPEKDVVRDDTSNRTEEKKKNGRAQENLQRYKRELSSISGNLERENELIVLYLQGDDTLKNTLIEMRLAKVVELAERYKSHPVPIEEVIAEGNLGLMAAMGIIENNRTEYLLEDGTLDREKFFGTLDMEVIHAMESFIDGETSSKDWEHTVLAKTNLLHEATKYLTEEMGRVPGVQELSEYTKIDTEEIRQIMNLSKDAGRIADTTHIQWKMGK